MAKKSKYDSQHITNIERYARQIEELYDTAAMEAAAIGTVVNSFNPDKPFAFADYPATKTRIDNLMKKLSHNIQTVIIGGIKAEWEVSNIKNDELVRASIGKVWKGKRGANHIVKNSKRYFQNNEPARDAFIARKESGLNLSDRVWRYTNQFKNEIEMGLDLGIREGKSADEIGRDLRQYLRQPDMLFRRVRDEHGQLHLSKRAAAYHPGAGVYRSSRMNALRTAQTEPNIAYRTADHTRWGQLDFVVGIEIRRSNNRCECSVCDSLAGKYPKDFKFTGWHPQCRCYAVPILKTVEEIEADNERLMNGEPLNGESANKVSGVPGSFKEWLTNNEDRISKAKSLPYFLRDNEKYVNPEEHLPTIAERAALRHSARTPMQIEAIRSEWNERKAIRHYGQNIMRYMGGISDVDTGNLSNALNGGDTGRILTEARKLKTTGKQILALNRLDNPMQVAREFSMADANMVNSSVEKKLAGWAHLSLEDQKKKLLFEIQWIENNKKYATWKVAQGAYRKELTAVVDTIDWAKISDELATATNFKTKSSPYKSLVAKLQNDITTHNKAAAQETIYDIKAKRSLLEKEAAKRDAKKIMGGEVHTDFADDAYSQKRKDKAVWCKQTSSSVSKFKDKADDIYSVATKEETEAAYRYTSGSGYVNRPLRGYDRYWDQSSFKGIGNVPLDNESPLAPLDIENLTKFINRSSYDKDIWLQRGIENDGLAGFLQIANLDDKLLQSLVGQTITDPAFMSCGAAKGTGFGGNIINIYCPQGTKMLYIDGRSSYASENEMLIQRNTRFRITKVEKAGWRYYIDIEVVGQI